MKQLADLLIKENKCIAPSIYEMILIGKEASLITKPGQFINIRMNDGQDPFLRRPISVSEYDEESITIVYKVVGKGTQLLAGKKAGELLNVLVGLGNGFELVASGHVVLIGGGVGIPPLLGVASRLFQKGVKITTILGFRTKEDCYYEEVFKQYGNVRVTTDDGSYQIKGNVMTAMQEIEPFDTYYACGPEIMLTSLVKHVKTPGWLSFEARMACGTGMCYGCTTKTKVKAKRICVDGPVFSSSEVIIHE